MALIQCAGCGDLIEVEADLIEEGAMDGSLCSSCERFYSGAGEEERWTD